MDENQLGKCEYVERRTAENGGMLENCEYVGRRTAENGGTLEYSGEKHLRSEV